MTAASFPASWLAGFLLAASLIVAIGAQNLFVLRQALRREHVWPVVALCVALDVVLMATGVVGLGASLGGHPGALRVLAGSGATFLVVYGVMAAHRAARPAPAGDAPVPPGRTRRAVLLRCAAISLLNPHVYLDTVLLVGSVGAAQAAAARPAFLLDAGMASGVWFTMLGAGGRRLAPLFARPGAWRALDALVAAMMLGLGAWLAASAVR